MARILERLAADEVPVPIRRIGDPWSLYCSSAGHFVWLLKTSMAGVLIRVCRASSILASNWSAPISSSTAKRVFISHCAISKSK